MGRYTTRMLDDDEIRTIIETLEYGYTHNGVTHRGNHQIATIMLLQANLGCRINDIVNLKAENFKKDGKAWRLDIIEEKTGKNRRFIVPSTVKEIVDAYQEETGKAEGRLFKVSSHAVWKTLRQVTDYLGMENVSAHSFRKAAGMRVYLDSDMDIALTCQFYQHSSPELTMRYLQRNTKQMDELLSRSVFVC